MRILRLLFTLVVLAVFLVAGLAGITIWYFGRDLPDYKQLANYQPPIVSSVYAGDGRLLAQYATEKRIFVPVKAMSHLVTDAFIAAEDKDFYSHPGVNFLSMARAALTDVARIHENRRPLGASTITQQVAKNFLLGNEMSLKRKIKEALVALRMEQVLSKQRILELYLNEIYLGRGSYGVAAAALTYFNKPLDQLDVAEAAFLGALPKAPSSYNPEVHPQAAKDRRDWVIDRMAEDGFITPAQAKIAKAEPLDVVKHSVSDTVKAPYFAEEVRRTLVARYGEKALYQGGLTVRTSLNPKVQEEADKALRDGLIAYDRRHGWRGAIQHIGLAGDWQARLAKVPAVPGADTAGWQLAAVLATDSEGARIGFADGSKGTIPFAEMRWAHKELSRNAAVGPAPRSAREVVEAGDVVLVGATAKADTYALEQIPEVAGALVAMDPHTGRVLALSGGFSYEISQFDRATQAYRQIGSAIKPFVYIAAFEKGLTPSTQLMDEPVVIDQGPGKPEWRPSNYTHRFYGLLTLRVGVEESRNLITARLGQEIGLDAVGQSIESFGIMDHMPHVYSMVLGAGETTPLRLTTAYAMLDNGGKKISPTLIDRVQDRDGVTIYRADQRTCSNCENIDYTGQAPPELPDIRKQIVDPQSDYQIVSVMQGVVQYGTGHALASLGRPIAGKTGTTNDSKDTWFVGFSPDLVAGVFVGFDNPRTLGGHETGASVALPVFKEFMGDALKDQPPVPFRIPPGLLLVRVDHHTGELPYPGDKTVILEAFKPGTQPTQEATNGDNGPQHYVDDEDAASVAPINGADDMAQLPSSPSEATEAVSSENGAPVPVQQITPGPPPTAPSTGTGGLY
jgi:penicillin-binding protein 1A